MLDANQSLGANPFTYYGQKSNSKCENAQNHFFQSWVKPTLIATVTAAVATPLAVLAGMEWGVLAAMGFIATPVSGIALAILTAAIVTVITLVAVLAIQSCYRYQNSSEANRQMFPVEITLTHHLEGSPSVSGYLEKRGDEWFWVLSDPSYPVNPGHKHLNQKSIIFNAMSQGIGYQIDITIGELDELNNQLQEGERIDRLTAWDCIRERPEMRPDGGDLENSDETNGQKFPVDITLRHHLPGSPTVSGNLEKRENKWFWVLSNPSYRVEPSPSDPNQPIIVNAMHQGIRCAIPTTFQELNDKHERGERIDRLTAVATDFIPNGL